MYFFSKNPFPNKETEKVSTFIRGSGFLRLQNTDENRQTPSVTASPCQLPQRGSGYLVF